MSLSRLGQFMNINSVTVALLAERSGVSRRHIENLRYGRSDPTLSVMRWLAGAASDILGSRVHVAEMFDLDYDVYGERG